MTDVPAGAGDAELVSRVLSADREAFALVYDRYGNRLYDFAYSMLRQREDAADAVADAFVIFAERLGQLRDPARLRPWLYAIVRSECLRRLKARKRVLSDDEQLAEMADTSLTPEQAAERAALQQLVWDAAAGLADRDRALLDLHLRQGLEGAELAEAMGVSVDNAYVMLTRLRAQVDRSLGALLVARTGRDQCSELDRLLGDWDGSFSPLIRKRVARHVEGCEICGERRRQMISPLALLAAVPLFAAPAALRDRVLDDTRLVAFHPPSDPPGVASAGPGPTTTIAPRTFRIRALVAAAAVLLLITGIVLFWPSGNDDPTLSPTADSSAPQLATPAVTPTPTTPPSPTPSPTTPGESATASPAALAGTLLLSTHAIDLGRTSSRTTLGLTTDGDLALSYRITSGAKWLTVTPATGRVGADQAAKITVRADRSRLPEGRSSGTFTVRWDGGSATVRVRVDEERNPYVGLPSTGANPSCSFPVRVTATDPSGISSVRLYWTGPNGSGSASMTRSGSTWTAEAGPFRLAGQVSLRAVAQDKRANITFGPTRTITVDPCPQ